MKPSKQTDRFVALEILIQVFEDRTPLSHLLQKPGISSLSKALCFGVIRHYTRLDLLATSLVDKRPKDWIVWLSVVLGLYQIEYMAMPDYAVVQETVSVLQQYKKSWAKGFVNALLRRYCREHLALKATCTTHPAFEYNHPKWLLEKIQHDWPTEWPSILAANDTHPPLSLRVNVLHHSRDEYSKQLNQLGIEHDYIEHTASGLILNKPCNVTEIPGFLNGDVSVQDGAAQLAGPLLKLQADSTVLDACCAPGGKTGHILELEPHLRYCLSLDADEKRLQRVQDNCNRLHLNATLGLGDARHPDRWWNGTPFDRILLDAPCSATGIIRRHPDIKLLRTPEEIQTIVELQAHILEALWPLLAPNGLFIYATCSIMPEENEQQIAQFVRHHPDAQIDPSPKAWGLFTGHGWQILPGRQQMDGFFYAVLTKANAPVSS